MSGILQLINTFPSGGFAVKNSLRFRSSASAYLSRTLGSTSNRKTFTYSFWVKRGTVGSSTGQVLFCATDNVTSSGFIYFNTVNVGSTDCFAFQDQISGTQLTTTQVFRDPSAWYHFVVAIDTTQATSSNRVKLFVNGTQITSFSTATYPSQNADTNFNYSSLLNTIGDYWTGSNWFLDGYLAEINFIDGQALTPSSFGAFDATSGVWQPVKYSGTYGTNGFYLKFSDTTSTTTLCYDYSGNGNNWTPNNISLTSGSTYDSMLDSPTNYDNGGTGVGNYAVLNPLDNGGLTINSANLNASDSAGSYKSIRATFGLSSGKWYWEVTATSGANLVCGVSKATAAQSAGNYVGVDASGWGYAGNNGQKYTSGTGSAYGSTYTSGDVVGVAFDADVGTLTFYKNNTSQGSAFTGLTSGPYFPAVSNYSSGWAINFGQRPFAYTPPSGYKALNTQNLPAASIVNGASYMAATLYTGNGATQSIVNAYNGVSFQPDFVWIKSRSAATDHALYDVIRGTQNRLESNTTDAAVASDNGLIAFGTSGFTVNTLAQVNTNAATYVGWQWKANGTAVTNTAGSITSQVSANTTAGFSVVTFAEPALGSVTVGHGLGVAPSFIVLKSRANTSQWVAYHSALANTQYLLLNLTNAATTSATVWNGTNPTSSVFSVGTDFNGLGNMVAYCFAAIAGYSAFGSYTGNGSADGPFVYTGFRPRFVLIKCSSTTDQWIIHDTARDPYNIANYMLFPNLSDGGYTYDGTNTSYPFDILSNGFKIRSTYPNSSGGTYIYAAFAENPFKYSLAR